MIYFSEDSQYINAECQSCGRILKIPRERCSTIVDGLTVTPAVLCKCGKSSSHIIKASKSVKGVHGSETQQQVDVRDPVVQNNVYALVSQLHHSKISSTTVGYDRAMDMPERVYTDEGAPIREAALRSLRSQASGIVDELCLYLDDKWSNPNVLHSTPHDPGGPVGRTIARILISVGKPALSSVKKVASEGNEMERVRANWILCYLGDSQGYPELKKMTTAQKVHIRLEAMILLREFDSYHESIRVTHEKQLIDLLRQGKKIDAIRVYRQHTNANFDDARDFVEKLSRTLESPKIPASAQVPPQQVVSKPASNPTMQPSREGQRSAESTQLDRFTEEAQSTAQHAAEVTHRYGHNQIDTEHLLLALIERPGGVIPQILEKLGVSPVALTERLDATLRASPKGNISGGDAGQIFITPRVKRIIDLANEEAHRLQDVNISTEHIFLAILTERNTPAARILESAGLKRDSVNLVMYEMRKSQSTTSHAIAGIQSHGYEDQGTGTSDIRLAAEAARSLLSLEGRTRIEAKSMDRDEFDALYLGTFLNTRLIHEGIHLYEALEPIIKYLTYVPMDRKDKSSAKEEVPRSSLIVDLIEILEGTGDKRAIPALTRIANTERKIPEWRREDTGGHPIEVESYLYLASNDYERIKAKTAIETILNQRYEICPDCNGKRILRCSKCGGTGEEVIERRKKVVGLITLKAHEKSKCYRCGGKKIEACGHCNGYGKLILKS